MLPPWQGELQNHSARRNFNNRFKNKKEPGFVPLTGQFNKKWDSVLFDAEKSLEELLSTKSDNAFKNIGTKFNQE